MRIQLDFMAVLSEWPLLLTGVAWTLSLTAISVVIGTFLGTAFAWVRARCLGGKTNIWGRLSLRLSDLDLKAKSHDGRGSCRGEA